MTTANRYVRPSRITIPKNAHPAAKIVFAEMRRLGMTYDEMEWASGVLKSTFKAWRTHNKPGLESIQAALGALGWEFLPVPRLENLPPAVTDLLAKAAEQWGSDDDLLCELIAQVATGPALTRARLLAAQRAATEFGTAVPANDERAEVAA